MDFWNRVYHTKLTERITEAVMSPSRCARPSSQASAAGVHINGWFAYRRRNPYSPIYWNRVCHTKLTKRITKL